MRMMLLSLVLMLLPVHDAAGQAHPYVAPSRIAGLPTTVRRLLESRDCRIPVVPTGTTPTPQAFRAALYAPAKPGDWAVACSRAVAGRRLSTIFVFRKTRGFAPDSIAEMGTDELHGPSRTGGAEAGYVSSRIYAETHSRTTLRRWLAASGAGHVDVTAWEAAQPMHDAVMVDVGAPVMWYWTGRRWLRIPFGD